MRARRERRHIARPIACASPSPQTASARLALSYTTCSSYPRFIAIPSPRCKADRHTGRQADRHTDRLASPDARPPASQVGPCHPPPLLAKIAPPPSTLLRPPPSPPAASVHRLLAAPAVAPSRPPPEHAAAPLTLTAAITAAPQHPRPPPRPRRPPPASPCAQLGHQPSASLAPTARARSPPASLPASQPARTHSPRVPVDTSSTPTTRTPSTIVRRGLHARRLTPSPPPPTRPAPCAWPTPRDSRAPSRPH